MKNVETWTPCDAIRLGYATHSKLGRIGGTIESSRHSRNTVQSQISKIDGFYWLKKDRALSLSSYFDPLDEPTPFWHSKNEATVLVKMKNYLANYGGVRVARGNVEILDLWNGKTFRYGGRSINDLWNRTVGVLPIGRGAPDLFGTKAVVRNGVEWFALFGLEVKKRWSTTYYTLHQMEYLERLHMIGVAVGLADSNVGIEALFDEIEGRAILYRFKDNGEVVRKLPKIREHLDPVVLDRIRCEAIGR